MPARRVVPTQYLISADAKDFSTRRMYLTRTKFSDHGRHLKFRTLEQAKKVAYYLMRTYPILKKYRVRVHGIHAENRSTMSIWQVNPLGVLTLLEGGSAASNIIKKNPSKRGEIVRAAKLLKSFSGHSPRDLLTIRQRPIKRGLVIGTLDGVPYTTIRDGKTERYVHEFAENARPLLIASSDGRRLGIVGGRFQFTEAGIVDT